MIPSYLMWLSLLRSLLFLVGVLETKNKLKYKLKILWTLSLLGWKKIIDKHFCQLHCQIIDHAFDSL